jgi:hypothetical protein
MPIPIERICSNSGSICLSSDIRFSRISQLSCSAFSLLFSDLILENTGTIFLGSYRLCNHKERHFSVVYLHRCRRILSALGSPLPYCYFRPPPLRHLPWFSPNFLEYSLILLIVEICGIFSINRIPEFMQVC